jgi:hypothetical protein
MTAIELLREGISYGDKTLTDEQLVLLVLDTLTSLETENKTLREYWEAHVLIKG